jgi:pyruvate dehydrogenase E2 component (dihydrolipoamide acetyltransferase)
MRHPIVIPNLGLVEFVTLVDWSRGAGDRVLRDEVVATVETEKAQVDIVAPVEGTLEIAIEAGPGLVPAEAVLGFVHDED